MAAPADVRLLVGGRRCAAQDETCKGYARNPRTTGRDGGGGVDHRDRGTSGSDTVDRWAGAR